MSTTGPPIVLPDEVAVVNVGLPMFADAVRAQGRPVEHVDWRPPAGGRPDAIRALTRLYAGRGAEIDAANAEVLRRLDTGVPFLVGVAPAGEVVPGVSEAGGRVLLHCGPAIGWEQVADPLRRSMRAATVAEGWAVDTAGADGLLASGAVRLEPANLHDTVVPMASAIGPTAPVLVIEMSTGDGTVRTFAPINQGPGEVPWFGRDTDAAIARLRLLRDVAGPAVAAILARTGPLDVLAMAAQGIAMGDDLHMRTQAATNLLVRTWLPHIAALPEDSRQGFADFLGGNHLFFLTLAMGAARALTAWAGQVTGSSIVTTMSRNGTTFGIRLAGSDRWYVTDSPPVGEALYYSGYGPDDAAPDIGDSAVLELVGLGGPAAGNSPAVAAFLGGSMADAARATEVFRRICVGASSRFTLPALGFSGTPVGVDVRAVVELGITPKVTTGILAAHSGVGQVGAGVATAPLDCFVAALLDLAGEDGGVAV
ncbi:DUF1116 domain-containing protein [Actinomycetospora callitridis]|uniref:DUF1116 domain-containing protein n=1 Tax=Actinomycetospora callitridis TaxID=913944 RepID=UPI0023673BA8|nr:DUF1116 domain-containing protein [Actinomycetospora callitridis]MDD7919007.1 DUF1116 domain-containing protein [Actinomycetospora callitridis]